MGSRRSTAAVLAVLTVLAAAAFGAADALGGGTPAGPSARLATSSQEALLSTRSVVATVSAGRRSTVDVAAYTGGRRITTIRRVQFRRAGRTRVALGLRSDGVRALRACTARRIELRMAVQRGKRRRTYVSSRALSLDPDRCKPPVTSTPTQVPPPAAPAPTVPAPPPPPPAKDPDPKPDPKPDPAPTVDLTSADRCEFLVPEQCLGPWPNDRFTVADATTDTGRRVALVRDSMPANKNGVRIDPAAWNTSDGFSPGSALVVRVPGLDTKAALAKTGVVPITDFERSFDPDQPVVLIDAATGERIPLWAELDERATTPAERDLYVHPAVHLKPGHRYIAALRHLRTADGTPIEAREAFRIYRDGQPSEQAAVEERRAHFEDLFDTLGDAGIERESLYLAWDFTVASSRNLTGRMLKIRDHAFGLLGDTNLADLGVAGTAPTTTVDSTVDYQPCSAGVNASCETGESDLWLRRIRGTVTVPCYLTSANCAPGGSFRVGADGLPEQNGTTTVPYSCNLPRTVATPGTRLRPTMYGHGLFGSYTQTEGSKRGELANTGNLMMCGTDFKGMASDDQAVVGGVILPDLSKFNLMADRMQQGLLNFLYLGRAMIHPNGFADDAAFQVGGQPVVDTRRLFYTGVSEGGILGGALTAVAPDHTKAALIVPGMNYSILLPRSKDYDPFEAILNDAYRDESDRQFVLQLIQMLWDRGEPSGYVHAMTDNPLPNTPRHRVLLSAGFADQQVSPVTVEIQTRTLNGAVRGPVLDPGRSLDVDPFWNIPVIGSWPYTGSAALTMWDIGPRRADPVAGTLGTDPAPLGNVPPRPPNVDPHGPAGQEALANQQVAAFLDHGGNVINTCGPNPCYAAGWTGP